MQDTNRNRLNKSKQFWNSILIESANPEMKQESQKDEKEFFLDKNSAISEILQLGGSLV